MSSTVAAVPIFPPVVLAPVLPQIFRGLFGCSPRAAMVLLPLPSFKEAGTLHIGSRRTLVRLQPLQPPHYRFSAQTHDSRGCGLHGMARISSAASSAASLKY